MSALTNQVPAPVETPLKPVPVKPPEEKSKTRRYILGGLLILIGAIAAYLVWGRPAAPQTAAPTARTAKAFVGPLEVTLRMTGTTSARDFANVITPRLQGPESRGSLTLLKLAPSGSRVKKGDLLAQIDAQSAIDHIDDLADTVAAAENDIRKRKAEQAVEWESMQQTLRVAKASLDKATLEHQAAEVKTQIERELLKLAVDEADARYKQQANDVAQRRAAQAAEIRILEITLDRHHRHVNRHKHDLEAFTIHSPMDGLAVMNTLNRGGELAQFQVGDNVAPGQPLMKVVDLSSMQVEGSVSQADSGDLRVGQRVRIGFDAFKEISLSGKIYSLGALAAGGWRQNNYIRSVPVRVAIEGNDPRLIPDLSAHCDIILGTVPNQLQVPLAGVREQNGKATVMVRSGEGWAPREVTLGKRNNSHVAIAGGLTAGEEIRLN
jgi:HlyD family secretion protein